MNVGAHLPRRRVVALFGAIVLLVSAMTVLPGSVAQAVPTDSHQPASWNMARGSDRWDRAYRLSRTHDVVALQEVPQQAPSAATLTPRRLNGVQEYTWRADSRDPVRYLYIYRTGSQDLGMITTWQADDAFAINAPYRAALGVVNNATGTMVTSLHAASPNGNDATALIERIAARGAARNWNWLAIGDFNRVPANLVLPSNARNARVYNPGQATHRGTRTGLHGLQRGDRPLAGDRRCELDQ
jgi:cytolethal distending toxin subunit B